MSEVTEAQEWLVLIHQIPPKPAYLRVKVGRRLARIGAVPLKNSVYLLPTRESCQEDFQWVVREVRGCGGEATLLRAQVVDGLDDTEVEALFNSERERDYEELLVQVRQLVGNIEADSNSAERERTWEADLVRHERKLDEVSERDFFGAPGREVVGSVLRELRKRLTAEHMPTPESERPSGAYVGRTWVTRRGVHVDRIASAWLIRRFIDASATFKFVASKGYAPEPGELRFDMYDAEFTHEGDLCTFEVLCARFGVTQPGVSEIGELIHDLDIKDERYGRPETPGVSAQLQGITLLHEDDEPRILAGTALLESLLRYFASKGQAP